MEKERCGNCEYCVPLGDDECVCVYCPMVGDMASGIIRVDQDDRPEEYDCGVWERRTWRPAGGCAA